MNVTSATESKPWLPPRWIIRLAWVAHRAAHRFTGGRRGLKLAQPGKEGYMRLRTVGRRSGRERVAILAYFEDGPNLITMAMNGWADPEPAWWLNLLAQPEAMVDLKDGKRPVCRGRRADQALGRTRRAQRLGREHRCLRPTSGAGDRRRSARTDRLTATAPSRSQAR